MPRGRWKPGESGNPKGAPRNERALSNLIMRELSHTTLTPDGKRIARKRLMAAHMAEALSTGKITFADVTQLPDGTLQVDVRSMELKGEEYADLIIKLLRHIEGEKHQVETDIKGDLSNQIAAFNDTLKRVYGDNGTDTNVPGNPEE